MSREMLELAHSTSDANLADVFRRLAEQYRKLAETQERLDRSKND